MATGRRPWCPPGSGSSSCSAPCASAHWGADQVAEPLGKLRRQLGLSPASGAAFLALGTASPEVGINTASAVQGVSDIGLGNLLGSNIVSVPLVVTTAWLAQRSLGEAGGRDRPRVPVHGSALRVQALPYLAVVGLVAVLTLPPAWRGLQPADGVVMALAYVAYVVNAALRDRGRRQDAAWKRREVVLAAAGMAAIVAGAWFTVTATEQLVNAFGISQLIGGLFITSTMSTAPEVFATWSAAKAGEVTAATTTVIADNTLTFTLAFVPLALVTTPVDDLPLYLVNLGAVAVLGALYALFVWLGRGTGFSGREVVALDAAYLVYLVAVLVVVLG